MKAEVTAAKVLGGASCIWILEDDPGSRFVYQEILGIRYPLRIFEDLATYQAAIDDLRETPRPALILADLRLPDGSFIGMLESSSEGVTPPDVPLVVVSSMDDLDVLRRCYERGATDYLTKPFSKSELIVKVERILKAHAERRAVLSRDGESFQLKLDTTTMCVARDEYGPVPLTSKEFQILTVLRSSSHPVTREEIVHQVWGGVQVTRKTLDVHFVNLRRKLRRLGLDLKFVAPRAFTIQVMG